MTGATRTPVGKTPSAFTTAATVVCKLAQEAVAEEAATVAASGGRRADKVSDEA
ncbi:hypothetical protein PR003_g2931 [Phytophthora rubi]|uniref:Uncharacterized protein n=1 Tax=Phytophthora rubi TaxID=129364 RepID=A0A6A3P3C3_9STRA|nr:hypothetical protein PR002_g552 [Phytophthora rubi]KAE9052483.1 hypothetical protein PR001_g463 [Phytophthora rubi]KAE9355259.1 hypothetical protein PR003_g2931 [Phytophthora rubi]